MHCSLLDGNSAAKEDHLYELPSEVCKKWFDGHRFGRIGTIGDGSCFFHSVCLGLNVASYRTADRRKVAYALRKALSDSFNEREHALIAKTLKGRIKAYSEIKEGLANPKTWAEEIMIKWASKFLGANIVFLNLSNNENKPYCGVHDQMTLSLVKQCLKPGVPTVIVAWINSSHFELIVRIDDPNEASGVKVRTSFDPNDANDLETIQKLMLAYGAHCR